MAIAEHIAKVKEVLWPYPTRASRLRSGPRPPAAAADTRSYWQQNRWRWNATNVTLSGRFRTPYCAPAGKITRHHDGTFTLYIINPPSELYRHPHWSCFHSTSEKGVYYVHFSIPLKTHTLDAGIMEVERTLVESFEHRR